ncbi:MAG: hypothetical protein ACREYE_09775 [Gammaproteobacteria bacterium]
MNSTLFKTLVLAIGTTVFASASAVQVTPGGVQLRPNSVPLRHLFVPVGDGTVGFFLGMNNEPAYVLEANGYEIFAYADVVYDADGNFMDGRYIDESDNDPNDPETHPEDKVRLQASVELLAAEDPNAEVLASQKLGFLKPANSAVGSYLVEFLPNPAGPYALTLRGTLNGQPYHDRLLCSTGEAHTFSCIGYRVPSVF